MAGGPLEEAQGLIPTEPAHRQPAQVEADVGVVRVPPLRLPPAAFRPVGLALLRVGHAEEFHQAGVLRIREGPFQVSPRLRIAALGHQVEGKVLPEERPGQRHPLEPRVELDRAAGGLDRQLVVLQLVVCDRLQGPAGDLFAGEPDQPNGQLEHGAPSLHPHPDRREPLEGEDVVGPLSQDLLVDLGGADRLVEAQKAQGAAVGVVDLERGGLPVVVLGLRGPPQPAEATRRHHRGAAIAGEPSQVVLGCAERRAVSMAIEFRRRPAHRVEPGREPRRRAEQHRRGQAPQADADPSPPAARWPAGPLPMGAGGGRVGRGGAHDNMLTTRPEMDNRRCAHRPPGAQHRRRWGGRLESEPTARVDPQYESLLTTSPRFGVARAYQDMKLTELLTKWTDPSMNRTFTPPGWYELAATIVWVAPA